MYDRLVVQLPKRAWLRLAAAAVKHGRVAHEQGGVRDAAERLRARARNRG